MPGVLSNGVRLNTATLGPAEGAAGPPVVMLHGLLVGNLATWYFGPARALARRHRVLCFDLRGHGRSERPPSGYDVATMADDLAGLIEGFAPDEPVALVGHSWGALVALEHARRRPAGVARLALVEAPLAGAERGDLLSFLERPPEDMAAALPEALQTALAAGGRRARRFVEGLVALATETTLFDDLTREQAPDDAALAAIRCPTLLIYGRGSSCGASGQRLAAALPDASLAWLDGGHYLPLEAPAAIADLLEEFLRG